MSRHSLRRVAALALVALAVTAGSALAEDYEAPLWAKSTPAAATLATPATAATAPTWGPGACPRATGAAGRHMAGMHGMRGQMFSNAAYTGHPGHGPQAMHGWYGETR